jgi:diaminopimelate epimerase
MMGRTAESVGARVHWTKSHGLGNDYLVVEPAHLPPGVALTPATVRLICDRHRGVGGDGILELLPPTGHADRFGVRIWNPDGSSAEKSGNGIRIVAKYLREHGHTTATEFSVATTGGDATVALALADDERVAAVTVDMGTASFDPRETIPVEGQALTVSILSVGNPHCVVIVPDLDAVPFARLGPAIERHPAFPARTNVQFAQPMSDRVVRALIWERGAGETQASGSSACAVAAACHRRGLVGREVTVAMPGGDLTIRIGDAGRLWLHGPVEETCRGTFSAELVARLRALEA